MRRPVSFCSMTCAAQPAVLRAGEHRRGDLGRDLREVEHDRRPELHVGLEHPVRPPRPQLRQRRVLQRQRRLVPGRPEFLGGAAEHPGPRVLGPVDPVAEPHQPVMAVEGRFHVAFRVAGPLHLLEHVQHPGRGAAVQRARQGADRAGHRRGDVGAGGRDHPGGEGGGVHAVLGRADPVGVERLHVPRVGLAAPADEEGLGRGLRLVHQALRHGRPIGAAGRLGDEREHRRADPADVRPGLLRVDVEQRAQPPGGGEGGRRRSARPPARRRCGPAAPPARPGGGRG